MKPGINEANIGLAQDAVTEAAEEMIGCKRIEVSKDTCELIFGNGKIVETETFHTIRKELMLVHLNDKNEVLSIELVGDGKPCQK